MLTGQPPKFLKMSKYLSKIKKKSLAKELSLFERTVKPVKDLKLPYGNDTETEGDGNCFYNAIMDQIMNNPRVAETISDQARKCASPQDLREKVIDFIVNWPDTLNYLVVAKNNIIAAIRKSKNLPWNCPEDVIWQQHLLPKNKENGVFAEDIIIQCMPTFLTKDMYIISPETSKCQPIQTKWLHIPSFAGTNGPPITLASSQSADSSKRDKHFQSLIPMPTVASESTACRNCAKFIKKNIKSHLNQSKLNCWNMYDKDWMDQEAKGKSQEKKARYNAKNQTKIRRKQADYNAKHSEEIKTKQAKYNTEHRGVIKTKQAKYNIKNHEGIKIKQAKYNIKHREGIKIKQAKYNTNHREVIKIKQAKYNTNHRENIRMKQAKYNADHCEEMRKKHAKYNSDHREEIRIKQSKYNSEHREEIRKKLQDYREMYINKRKSKRQILEEMPGDNAAGWQLQQYEPEYIEFCGPNTRREVLWMDPEQLVDLIHYYKKKGNRCYRHITIDYSYMQTSNEMPPETNPANKPYKTKSGTMYNSPYTLQPQYNPENCEVGLSNDVIFPGEDWRGFPRMFRGEEVTEDINVIVKLKTLSSQPEVEKVEKVTDWPINHGHVMRVLEFWKRRDHLCLRGIRYMNKFEWGSKNEDSIFIPDWESTCKWTEAERRENEEKVVKSWKYFTTKPYHLLEKYHKNIAKELGRSSKESDYEDSVSSDYQETDQSDESFDKE